MDHRASPDSGPKLTNWANEPTVRQLKMDFEMARPSHDQQVGKIQRWNDLMYVKGTAAPKKVKGRSSVQPKLIRRQAEWRYSALTEPFLGSHKLFKIDPVTFEDEAAAKQNELLLNWQFRTKLNRVKFIDDFVRSTVDEGTSIIRTGWTRATVPIKQQVPVYQHFEMTDDQQIELFQQALNLKSENPHEYEDSVDPAIKAAIDYYGESGVATVAVQSGTETVTVDKVIENRPIVEVIDPRNFYIDPSCNGDVSRALFAIVSFETNKAELAKQPKRYKNLDQVNWEGSTPLSEPDHATKTPDSAQFADSLRKRVVAYEYWGFYDIHGTGSLEPVVVTWIGDCIIRMELNPFPDKKIPFVIVPYLPVKRDLYGEPDAELLEDNQKILGAVTRGMIDLLGRSANSQRGHAKGMLDALNKRKYENGDDYEFNPGSNPNNNIIEHKYPELPQSAVVMLNLQNQEAEALTGVKSFGGGMSGEAYGDVAAGIRGVLDAASKREMAILRRLAKGIAEVGQKLIAMNAVFLSEKEVVRVTNAEYVGLPPELQEGATEDPKTKDKFVTVNREDLEGNFDLEVDISTAEVDNAKSQDLAFMLQTMGPNMDVGLSMLVLADIADLKRMPALAQKIRNYKPQPSPEQQKLQELEILKAELEVEELRSKIQLNKAKAAETESKKDKTDLDYVEQETGTKHARDLEKQAGQARGNQDLEITKAFLKPLKADEKKPDVETAIGYKELSTAQDDPRPVEQPLPVVDNMMGTEALPMIDPSLGLEAAQTPLV